METTAALPAYPRLSERLIADVAVVAGEVFLALRHVFVQVENVNVLPLGRLPVSAPAAEVERALEDRLRRGRDQGRQGDGLRTGPRRLRIESFRHGGP